MRSASLRLLTALFILLALCCAPAAALTLNGQVLDHKGRPVAGAIISDEVGLTMSGQDGRFRLLSQPGRVVSMSAPRRYRADGRWWLPTERAGGNLVFKVKRIKRAGRVITLTIISDPHLYDAKCPATYSKPPDPDPALPMRIWSATAKLVRRQNPDLVICPGDMCMDADKGGPEHARRQFDLVKKAADMLPANWRGVPGNHDVRYADGRVDSSLWRQYFGPARQVYLLGPMAFIFLDNTGLGLNPAGKPRPIGELPSRALAWLQNALELLPEDTPLVLVTHYPLASPLAGVNPIYRGGLVLNADTAPKAAEANKLPLFKAISPQGKHGNNVSELALRDVDQRAVQVFKLLAKRTVVGLIAGHQHALYQARLNPISGPLHLLGAPALCGRWWRGDMSYQGIFMAPGYLMAWLSRDQAGWHLSARMMSGDWAKKP